MSTKYVNDLTHHHSRNVAGVMKVGFYGCSANGGAVVRIMFEDPRKKYPTNLKVDCPHCMKSHIAHPTWRKYHPVVDEGREAKIVRA